MPTSKSSPTPSEAAGASSSMGPNVENTGTNEKSATKDVVRYTRGATVRKITKEQWQAAGVEDQETTEWNVQNDHTLPVSDFSQAALEALSKDSDFSLPESFSSTETEERVDNID